MNENNPYKRVALVVNALSGNELKAGTSDSARVYGVLVDPSCGACNPGSALLLQNCPDRDNFNKTLLRVLDGWNSGDQLILYYSGHGEERKGLYHLCFGAETKSYYPFKNVLTELVSAGVNRAIVILDSCQSGAALRKGEKISSQPPIVTPDEIPKGLAIITSCRANENSYENDDQSQSLFTGLFCDAIMSGLGGSPTPDGRISVSDLVGWINRTITNDPKIAGFGQTSTYGIDGGAEHPVWIALNRSGPTILVEDHHEPRQVGDDGAQPPMSFDEWLTRITSFSVDVLKTFRERLRPDIRESILSDNLDDLTFLGKANLLSSGRLYATGVLLFSEQPEKLVPGAYVQCFQFAGTNRSAPQDQKEFYGPLIRQLEGAMNFIESRIEKVEITDQGALAARFEYQYPMVCIRELLANALCHRDYLDAARHTNVRVFQDRIEIVSPGSWVSKFVEDEKEMDLGVLESESATRNERLATSLRRIRLVETGGSGIPSALSDCKERGAKAPTALSKDGTVRVTVYPRANWSKSNFGRRGAKRFRVAFSFSDDKRDFVESTAAILAERFGKSEILYDRYHEAEFARPDLGRYLPTLYAEGSDLVVVITSRDFEIKRWVGLEWTAINDLYKIGADKALMFTRFGGAELPDIYQSAGFVDLDERTPEQAAVLILERLALNEGKPKDFYSGGGVPTATQAPADPASNNLPRLQPFFGREKELVAIKEAIDPVSRTWGALIDGPGGIGKTSLAIRAAELAPAGQFLHIFFLSSKDRRMTAEGERQLSDFVTPGYLDILNELAHLLKQPDLAKRPEAERARLLIDVLASARALLILDNLESLPRDQQNRLFEFLSQLPPGCKAIVTSRVRTDVDARIIRLAKLDQDAVLALIEELATDRPLLAKASPEECIRLYEETGGNPLLLRWIVGQLGRGRCRTIASALGLLRSAAADNDPLEFIFGDLLGTFTENETKTLSALTYFTQQVEVKLIAELADISSTVTEAALGDLSNRALVIPDEEEKRFALVPMVAEFMRRKRPEIVAETGSRLEKHAYALIMENGYQKHDRFRILDEAWPTVAPALPLFIGGPNTRLQTVCDALLMFLDFSGRWDEWLSLMRHAEAKAVGAADHDNAGWRAYEAGVLFYRRQEADAILDCADRAAMHWNNGKAGSHERSIAIHLRGLAYSLKKDYEAAIGAYKESLRLRRSLAPESRDVAIVLNLLAEAEGMSGNLAAAERDYLEALRLTRKVGDQEGEALITGNLSVLAHEREDSSQAEALAREALMLSERLGRQELIASNCLRIAEAMISQGKRSEALLYARRAVEIYFQLGSPELTDARELLSDAEREV